MILLSVFFHNMGSKNEASNKPTGKCERRYGNTMVWNKKYQAPKADEYKVTNKDGTTEYKQYVRNDDDTYCFVPVDEKGNPLI